MKRLLNVLMLTLAMNFLVVAGAVGWLYQGGRLNRERVNQIKLVLFPPPEAPAGPTSQPAPDPTTRPTLVPGRIARPSIQHDRRGAGAIHP